MLDIMMKKMTNHYILHFWLKIFCVLDIFSSISSMHSDLCCYNGYKLVKWIFDCIYILFCIFVYLVWISCSQGVYLYMLLKFSLCIFYALKFSIFLFNI